MNPRYAKWSVSHTSRQETPYRNAGLGLHFVLYLNLKFVPAKIHAPCTSHLRYSYTPFLRSSVAFLAGSLKKELPMASHVLESSPAQCDLHAVSMALIASRFRCRFLSRSTISCKGGEVNLLSCRRERTRDILPACRRERPLPEPRRPSGGSRAARWSGPFRLIAETGPIFGLSCTLGREI